jgi:hypothetical protein
VFDFFVILWKINISMKAITLDELTEKLKYAPNSILEKIWGYAYALLENNELTFKLSEEQKQHLLKQNQIPLEQFMDADEVYKQLKKKYKL